MCITCKNLFVFTNLQLISYDTEMSIVRINMLTQGYRSRVSNTMTYIRSGRPY